MLKAQRHLAGAGITCLLLRGMVAGAAIGHYLPAGGQWLGERMDATLLLLIVLLLVGVRFEAIVKALGHVRFIGVVLLVNFVLVPAIGYVIASSFLNAHPLLMVGLTIYFMAPCTDWFLGFTRLANGNVALGTALIPINMVMQLLLYPLYLYLFTRNVVEVNSALIGTTLLQWFLLPLAVAIVAHHALRLALGSDRFGRLLERIDRCPPWSSRCWWRRYSPTISRSSSSMAGYSAGCCWRCSCSFWPPSCWGSGSVAWRDCHIPSMRS